MFFKLDNTKPKFGFIWCQRTSDRITSKFNFYCTLFAEQWAHTFCAQKKNITVHYNCIKGSWALNKQYNVWLTDTTA